jgi:hypothetical protein
MADVGTEVEPSLIRRAGQVVFLVMPCGAVVMLADPLDQASEVPLVVLRVRLAIGHAGSSGFASLPDNQSLIKCGHP